jgi:hypothetical protein
MQRKSLRFEIAHVLMRLDDVIGIIVKLFVADVVMRATPHIERYRL